MGGGSSVNMGCVCVWPKVETGVNMCDVFFLKGTWVVGGGCFASGVVHVGRGVVCTMGGTCVCVWCWTQLINGGVVWGVPRRVDQGGGGVCILGGTWGGGWGVQKGKLGWGGGGGCHSCVIGVGCLCELWWGGCGWGVDSWLRCGLLWGVGGGGCPSCEHVFGGVLGKLGIMVGGGWVCLRVLGWGGWGGVVCLRGFRCGVWGGVTTWDHVGVGGWSAWCKLGGVGGVGCHLGILCVVGGCGGLLPLLQWWGGCFRQVTWGGGEHCGGGNDGVIVGGGGGLMIMGCVCVGSLLVIVWWVCSRLGYRGWGGAAGG
uniref:Uncharacterized protein n=1 Tax=Knipowitschia caucasica TaxID=637954 RepID=A0AAV2M6K9_KNICA